MSRHLAFFHQNYPAQFGPIIQFLLKEYDVEVSFFSEFKAKEPIPGMRHYQYKPFMEGGGNPKDPFFFTRYFEEECRSMYGVYNAFQAAKLKPVDAFVGHVGFGNLMFLHAEYPEIPSIGFFEIFYDPFNPTSDNRPEFPVPKPNLMRIPIRNATQLIELEYCTKGYSPTPYQKSTFPKAYQDKLSVIFDGVDVNHYQPAEVGADSELKQTWPLGVKLVTYVARGLEAYRGFDVFMDIAHKICQKRDDVHFIVAGKPQTCYGSEAIHLKGQSFKDYVLAKKEYDLSRFHFFNWISESALVDLYRLSDCHFYWTVPFTLSWSFFQALSTGVVAVASDSEPVRDLIRHGENGYMFDPFDVDAWVDRIMDILDDPQRQKTVREAARQTIVENYSFEVCLPKLAEFYLGNVPTSGGLTGAVDSTPASVPS